MEIAALIEGRGENSGTIGMAAIDIYSLQLFLYQFVDTTSYTLLNTTLQLLEPTEVSKKIFIVCDTINFIADYNARLYKR